MTAPTPAPPTAAELVTRYASTFNATHLTSHGVASPLGVWLLLALLAPQATGPGLADLERALGAPAPVASALARDLLNSPHPAVTAALAAWSRAALVDTDRWHAWATTLPTAANTDAMPTQDGADRWVSTVTGGLLEAFPAEIGPETALVLASALAARVTWTHPLTPAAATDLAGPFGREPHVQALQAAPAHRTFLAHTQSAGVVAVHCAQSADGLRVISVIAAPDVAPAGVHAGAAQIAALLAGPGGSGARMLSLFDLPVGTGHAFDIAEDHVSRLGAERVEEVTAFLPTWAAASNIDLAAAPGVAGALAVLESFLAPGAPAGPSQARQSAVASFHQDGFEAAAVTAMRVGVCNAGAPTRVVRRRATLRFNRPYAVLALAVAKGTPTASLWDQVPVFSAWVGSPAPHQS